MMFFFSSRRRHTRYWRDWSSDVCSSDLQLGALDAFAKANGTKLQHIKLHGAFYNMAAVEKELADAVLEGVEQFDKEIILMTLSGSYMAKEGKRRGLRVAEEVFADRGYNVDGTQIGRAHV